VQQWEIREVNPSDYDWETTDELPTYVPSVIPNARVDQPVPGWTVSPAQVLDGAGRPRRAALRFQWDGDEIDADSIRVQIRVQGLTNTWAYTIADVDAGDVVYSSGILPSVTYEARARLVQPGPTQWSAWMAATTADLTFGPRDIPSIDWQSLLPDSAMASGAPGSPGSVWGKIGGTAYDTYCTYGAQTDFALLAGKENASHCVRIGAVPASAATVGFGTQGNDNRIEVEPGETYRASCRVYFAGGRTFARTAISWRGITGSEIAVSTGTTFDLTTAGQWLWAYGDFVAPAGAVYGIPRFMRVANDLNAGNAYFARPRAMRRNFEDVTNDGDVSLQWNSYTAGWVTFSGNAGDFIETITISDPDVCGKQAFVTFMAQVGLERTGSAGRARGTVDITVNDFSNFTSLSSFDVQHRVAANEEIQFPLTLTRKVTLPNTVPFVILIGASGLNDVTGAGNVFRLRYRRTEVSVIKK
jgi:hypothetical protein